MKRLVAALFLACSALPRVDAEPWLWTETVELRFESARPVSGEVTDDNWDARLWVVAGTVDDGRELMSPGQTLRTVVNPARLLECVTHVFRADMYGGPPSGADAVEWRPPMTDYDFGSTFFTVDVAALDRRSPQRITVPISVPVRHLAGPPTRWEVVFIVTVT